MFALYDGLLFLAQAAVVLAFTTLCGALLKRLHQPQVVGEILGGLLLGPLVLGNVLPQISAVLFAPNHIHGLEFVSNIGLVLFLFYVGMELDLRSLRRDLRPTIAVTAGSIIVPFALGSAISSHLAIHFPSTNAHDVGFALFSGVVFSITAFPVLARILQERRNLLRPVEPYIEATTLIAAAVNDLLGWSLMAVALTLLPAGASQVNLNGIIVKLLLLAGFLGLMLAVVRPLLARLRAGSERGVNVVWIAGLLALALVSSQITDALGVHAFFGTFLAGVCVPVDSDGERRLESKISGLLLPITRFALPLFFAMTGLRMQPKMFSSSELLWLLVVLLVAVMGKIGGAAMAGRISGSSWNAALQIGILMNTRGLVELIVLNLGYRERALSRELFTLLVMMALITTAMTVPLLDLFQSLDRSEHAA